MDPNDPRVDELARRAVGADKVNWEGSQNFMRWLESPAVRLLAHGLGVDVAGLRSQQREVRDGTVAFLSAAQYFGPLGWTVTGRSLKTTDYAEAVRAWEKNGDEAEVDSILTRAWSDPLWLRHAYGPVTTLAGRHAGTRAPG